MKTANMIAVGLAALLVPAAAEAFVVRNCVGAQVKWQAIPVWEIHRKTFPLGSTGATEFDKAWQQLEGAAEYASSGTSWRWHQADVNQLVRIGDNSNVVVGHQAITVADSLNRAAGWAAVRSVGCEIREVDVVLNANATFFAGDVDPNGRPAITSLRTTVIHELLHGAGIYHEAFRPTRLFANVYPGSFPYATSLYRHKTLLLPPDDRVGLRFLYPAVGSSPDVVGSQFELASRNVMKRVNQADDHIVQTETVCGGDQVTVDLAIANVGNSDVTAANRIAVALYLSSDDIIWPTDREVMRANLRVDKQTHVRLPFTFFVPDGLAGGSVWFLGAYIDPDQAYAGEADVFNNDVLGPAKLRIAANCP